MDAMGMAADYASRVAAEAIPMMLKCVSSCTGARMMLPLHTTSECLTVPHSHEYTLPASVKICAARRPSFRDRPPGRPAEQALAGGRPRSQASAARRVRAGFLYSPQCSID
jgi:hypothetical protein